MTTMKKQIILVLGAAGQIGTELTIALRHEYGWDNVIAADTTLTTEFDGMHLDVCDTPLLRQVIWERKVTQVYLLAARLNVTGEEHAGAAWALNVQCLLSVLEIARDFYLDKVFWPSSIAVFGPGSPRYSCPQYTSDEPDTVDGISKRAGEYWCNYYFEKYGVDVRSLRYPGLIFHQSSPDRGTTDYATDIFHQVLETRSYTCYLSEDNCLPLMYIADAVRATLELMAAPKEKLSIRTSYNLAGCSFAPCDLAAEIKKHMPDFRISYLPDHRDTIAKNHPASINDEQAQKDWGWKAHYTLAEIARDMLLKVAAAKNIPFEIKASNHDFFPDYPADYGVFTQY